MDVMITWMFAAKYPTQAMPIREELYQSQQIHHHQQQPQDHHQHHHHHHHLQETLVNAVFVIPMVLTLSLLIPEITNRNMANSLGW